MALSVQCRAQFASWHATHPGPLSLDRRNAGATCHHEPAFVKARIVPLEEFGERLRQREALACRMIGYQSSGPFVILTCIHVHYLG